MPYVTSYGFLYPILVAGFVAVWLLSKTKYDPAPNPLKKPSLLELASVLGWSLVVAAGQWIIYSKVPVTYWSLVSTHAFPLLG